jgi:hypothetical protein
MGVWIDTARHNKLAARVDNTRFRAGSQSLADLADCRAKDAKICGANTVGIYDATASDEDLACSRLRETCVKERESGPRCSQRLKRFPSR